MDDVQIYNNAINFMSQAISDSDKAMDLANQKSVEIHKMSLEALSDHDERTLGIVSNENVPKEIRDSALEESKRTPEIIYKGEKFINELIDERINKTNGSRTLALAFSFGLAGISIGDVCRKIVAFFNGDQKRIGK